MQLPAELQALVATAYDQAFNGSSSATSCPTSSSAGPLQTTVPGEEHQRRLQDFVDELKAMPVAVQVRPPQITGGCRTLAGSGGQPDAGARRLRPPHGVLRSSPALRTGSAPALLHADGCC